MTQHVGSTLHHQTTGKIKEKEKEIDNIACRLHTTSSNKRENKKKIKEIDNVACGLHTTLSNKKGKNKKQMTWHVGCMPHCQTIGKGKKNRRKREKIDKVVCGLYTTLLFSSQCCSPLLPTPLTLLQPAQLVIIILKLLGVEAALQGCCRLLNSTSIPWVSPDVGIPQGAQWQQWVATQ